MTNYRGGLESLFWQAVAKSYNADMKETYDPVVDYQIEEIIKTLEIENPWPVEAKVESETISSHVM